MVSRRTMIAGGAGAAVLAALGYRAWDRGAFAAGEGPAFEAWQDWEGRTEAPARRPLHAAVLAASAHNTQPWLFEPNGDSITVYADLSRNLGAADPFRRELYQSIGCAITNIRLAAEHINCRLAAVMADEDHVIDARGNGLVPIARIGLNVFVDETVIDHCGALYRAIPDRHTNRGPYLPDRNLPELKFAPQLYDPPLWPAAITDPGRKKALGEIIVDATRRFIADRQMSEDSARWFRTGRREIARHRDGISTDGAGLSPMTNFVAKLLPDQNAAEADKYWLAATQDVQVPTAAAFHLAFVKDRLANDAALSVGEWWQRSHLWATANGLAAQPMNAPIEIMDRDDFLGRTNDYAKEIRKIARVSEGDPAFIFRLGYAERPAMPSPRRRLDDVVKAPV